MALGARLADNASWAIWNRPGNAAAVPCTSAPLAKAGSAEFGNSGSDSCSPPCPPPGGGRSGTPPAPPWALRLALIAINSVRGSKSQRPRLPGLPPCVPYAPPPGAPQPRSGSRAQGPRTGRPRPNALDRGCGAVTAPAGRVPREAPVLAARSWGPRRPGDPRSRGVGVWGLGDPCSPGRRPEEEGWAVSRAGVGIPGGAAALSQSWELRLPGSGQPREKWVGWGRIPRRPTGPAAG